MTYGVFPQYSMNCTVASHERIILSILIEEEVVTRQHSYQFSFLVETSKWPSCHGTLLYQSVGEILDRGIIPSWGNIPWRIFIEIAPGATGQRILIYWRKYWMFSEEEEKAYKSPLQVEWVIVGLNVQTGIVFTIHSFSIPGPVSIPFPIKIFMIRILIL